MPSRDNRETGARPVRSRHCEGRTSRLSGKLTTVIQTGRWREATERETEIETVQREVQEETSIEDIDVIKAFKQQIGYFYKRDGNLVDKSVVFYLAKTETEQVKISYEHKGFEWLSYDEALEKLTFKNAKDILEKANNFLVKNKTLDEFY